MILVLMGVAGSGKSTVGQLFAHELGWPFLDADDFHSPANRAKMSAGIPLDDADRAPWLDTLHAEIASRARRGESALLACSALKATYRDVLQREVPDLRWVFLRGSPELLHARLVQRTGHYMSPAMLASQLATLEPPADALSLDVAATPRELVAQIRAAFGV
jgi:gluconokinase